MKLSENQHYINHVILKVKGDFSGALREMMLCMQEAEQRSDLVPSRHSFFMQLLGEVKYLNHEIDAAFELYERSLETDKDSLFPELGYAKFLTHLCQDYKKALIKCDFIIDSVKSGSYEPEEDDMPIAYYLDESEELRRICIAGLTK